MEAEGELILGKLRSDEQVVLLDPASIYRETADSRCDFGEIFTTDGRIDALGLELVSEDGVFFVYNPSLTFRAEVFEANEQLDEIARLILAPLDDATMIDLNRRVAFDGENPADVAMDYLVAQGLAVPAAAAPEDAADLEDQQVVATDFHFGARVLAEQDPVTHLYIQGPDFAALKDLAAADGGHFSLDGLLSRGVRDHDAAGGGALLLLTLDDDAIVQRTNIHLPFS